jgi:hypothetical protein
MSPSPSTSSKAECTGAASVPVGPNSTEVGSAVVASKVSVVRIATGTFPLLLGLMLFGKLPGLMSIAAGIAPRAQCELRATARKREVGPLEAACRGGLQTASSGCGQKPWS